MDEDIIIELKSCLASEPHGLLCAVPIALVRKAIARIEFLRLHAGAITEGQTFEEITKDVKKVVPFG